MAKFVLYKSNGKIYKLEAELPPSDAYVIFELDVDSPEDIILDNGQIRVKTETEKLAEEKQKKLAELKSYIASLLQPTDYTIIKIAEAEVKGDEMEVERLKQKYAQQLQEREAIRKWNEQMKQAIRNAKNLEELRSIEIRYG